MADSQAKANTALIHSIACAVLQLNEASEQLALVFQCDSCSGVLDLDLKLVILRGICSVDHYLSIVGELKRVFD